MQQHPGAAAATAGDNLDIDESSEDDDDVEEDDDDVEEEEEEEEEKEGEEGHEEDEVDDVEVADADPNAVPMDAEGSDDGATAKETATQETQVNATVGSGAAAAAAAAGPSKGENIKQVELASIMCCLLFRQSGVAVASAGRMQVLRMQSRFVVLMKHVFWLQKGHKKKKQKVDTDGVFLEG